MPVRNPNFATLADPNSGGALALPDVGEIAPSDANLLGKRRDSLSRDLGRAVADLERRACDAQLQIEKALVAKDLLEFHKSELARLGDPTKGGGNGGQFSRALEEAQSDLDETRGRRQRMASRLSALKQHFRPNAFFSRIMSSREFPIVVYVLVALLIHFAIVARG